MKNFIILLAACLIFSCGNEAANQTKDAVTKTTNKTAQAKTDQIKPKIQAPPSNKKPTFQRPPAKQLTLAEYKAKNEGWLTNFEQAMAQSKKTGKPIMANFTGSDWCGWCKKLDKSVFHQPGFKEWADKNVVLLELDFPKRFRVPQEIAAQNNNLRQAFKVTGYPTIWVFDADEGPDGKPSLKGLGKTGYTKTLKEFQQKVDGFLAAK